MGYHHVPHKTKLMALSFTLVGLSQTEAAREAGLNSSKSLSRWLNDRDLVREAEEIISRAKAAIVQPEPEPCIITRSGRRFTAASYEAMRANGRKRAEQIRAQRVKKLTPPFEIPSRYYFDGEFIRPKKPRSRIKKYTPEGFAKMMENGKRAGRENGHHVALIPLDKRRENGALGSLARHLRKIERQTA